SNNFNGNDIKTPEFIVEPGFAFSPSYNPYNKNEIAYFKQDTSTGNIALNTFDIITKKETVVLPNALVFGPSNPQIQWKSPNTLSFIRTDGNIYTVHTDGSHTNAITSVPTYTHHTWKNDSIIIAEYSENGGTGFFNKAEINTLTSDVQLSAQEYFMYGALHPNGSYVYVKHNDANNIFIRYSNEEEKRITDNILSDRDSITGVAWHPDYTNVIYTTYRGGIFSVNTATSQAHNIRIGCDTKSYRHITISPDGKQIVVQRVDAHENTDQAKWIETHSLYLMDINGKNEQKIAP